MGRVLVNLCLLMGSCVLGFVGGEIAVRALGHYDMDGNFYFQQRMLKPYRLPVTSIKNEVTRYLAHPNSFLMYDSLLGWKPRPGSVSQDGKYHYDTSGVRYDPEAIHDKGTAQLHIAIFGDSFTHGSEVVHNETWGALLETRLSKHGIPTEVLNLGVAGYGIDQAYLRWQHEGMDLRSEIVVLGFTPVDIQRNVNMIRTAQSPTVGLPFSKPRFILTETSMRIINQPTPAPQELVTILSNFEDWPWARYEAFYQPEDYQRNDWRSSRFVSLFFDYWEINRFNVHKKVEQEIRYYYNLNEEPAQLSLRIIERFANEVERQGARFLIVHLPSRKGLQQKQNTGSLRYADLLSTLSARFELVDTTADFLSATRTYEDSALFEPHNHYSAVSNDIVAEAIASYLLTNLNKS